MSVRRVAITGLGILTPCGQGWQAYWKAVTSGQSAIERLSSFPAEDFTYKFGGEIKNFDPTEYIKQRKSLKVMSREIQLALAASHLAVQDSGVKIEETDRTRFGISLGTGIINNDLDEIAVGIKAAVGADGKFSMDKFGSDGIRSLFPLWFLKYLPNMPACHISMAHGLRGPSNTVTTSSAAGAQAIGEAFKVIQRGDADVMIAGSTDSKLNAMGISRFQLLGLLSEQTTQDSYRPFDKRHDGITLGEGAGLVVLEEWDHAKKRGARIYGEIMGYGSASDYNHDLHATDDFNGKRYAMTRALADAQVNADEIDFLMANGSGVPQEDINEARAVESVFENSLRDLKVTGVKPITGHLVYGSGGVELGAAALSLHEGVVPPLANFQTPDKDCDLPFVKGKPESFQVRRMILNSFGFGGQNASLVLRKA